MSTATPPRLMTAEDLLALPEDGMERWIVRGELRERPMTYRNRWHSRVLIRLGHLLEVWLQRQPEPRGQVLGGEAGVRLQRNPDMVFGVDVLVISAELAAREPADSRIINGVPSLAVEILSPSDTQEDIKEKVHAFLQAGVPLVWIVDYEDETVLQYQPGKKPQLFNSDETLHADPILPGFQVKVAEIFQ